MNSKDFEDALTKFEQKYYNLFSSHAYVAGYFMVVILNMYRHLPEEQQIAFANQIKKHLYDYEEIE